MRLVALVCECSTTTLCDFESHNPRVEIFITIDYFLCMSTFEMMREKTKMMAFCYGYESFYLG